MTSPVRSKQKFETFVMTGDTMIKTRSISPQLESSQTSLHNSSKIFPHINSDDTPINTSNNKYINYNNTSAAIPLDGNFVTTDSCSNMHKVCLRNSELDIPPDDIFGKERVYEGENVTSVNHPSREFVMDSSENPSFTSKDISSEDVMVQSQLNRHRSYDSITEGKNLESDKINTTQNTPDSMDHIKVGVRNYKSHENYLQLEDSIEFIPIVFDEAGAISIDALNYNRIEFPNPKYSINQEKLNFFENNFNNPRTAAIPNESDATSKIIKSSAKVINSINENCGITISDTPFPNDSLTRNSKDADLPSAQRLAKRLFLLDGFQQIDVAKHLGKRDSFSLVVAQEYLKHFDFKDQKLDFALRSFLNNLILVGETQERERVLAQFSHRFIECNKGFGLSQDSCHTLICAMMLLNIDHHSQNVAKKMTLEEFVENLYDLNDGKDFPEHLLEEVYHSVCDEPFKCPMAGISSELIEESNLSSVGKNPFLSMPDTKRAREYKRGFVMRKCCIDPDGHRTSIGKRGWRMFYARLKDLVLYLHKDEHGMKRNSHIIYENHRNAIRIHHALAEKAGDYVKKQHVFRLTTSDSAQFLFQTSDNAECQSWVNCLNYVAASLSSAPLPSAVGSQKKFERPLMPSSLTKLDPVEQLKKLKTCLSTLEIDLEEHKKMPLEKGLKSRVIADFQDKEKFLTFEVKRFRIYCSLLQPHIVFQHNHAVECNTALQDVMEECNTSDRNLVKNFKRSHSDRPTTRPAFLINQDQPAST